MKHQEQKAPRAERVSLHPSRPRALSPFPDASADRAGATNHTWALKMGSSFNLPTLMLPRFVFFPTLCTQRLYSHYKHHHFLHLKKKRFHFSTYSQTALIYFYNSHYPPIPHTAYYNTQQHFPSFLKPCSYWDTTHSNLHPDPKDTCFRITKYFCTLYIFSKRPQRKYNLCF